MSPNGILGRVTLISTDPDITERLAPSLAPYGYMVGVSAEPAPRDAATDVVLLDGRAQSDQALVTLLRVYGAAESPSAVIVLLADDPTHDLLQILVTAQADYLIWPAREQALMARIALARARHTPNRRKQPDPPASSPLGAAMLPRQRVFDALFRRTVDEDPLGVMIVSPANQIEYVNAALCQFLGYTREELVGRQPGFMVSPEDHAATVTKGHLLAAGQINHFVEERRRYIRKDGSVVLGKLTVHAPRDPAGLPLAFLAFIENIGSRVWVEDQLARYTRYQQALANASLALLTVAPDERARATALRDALQQLLDGAATGRAYLFRNVEDVQLGLALERVAEAWAAGQHSLSQLGQTSQSGRFAYASLPRSHREAMLAGLPSGGTTQTLYADTPELMDIVLQAGIRATQTVPVHVEGQLWGFLGFDDHTEARMWDHTDLMLLTSGALMIGQTLHRWQIEDDLRATSQFLHTTGRVARVGGWAANVELGVLQISEELANLLELDGCNELDFEQMLAFYAPEARAVLRDAARTAIRTGGGWELELPMNTARGRPIWVNAQGHAEQRDGRTVRLYGVVQDVTRRKEAEVRLEQQLQIEAALVKCSQELLVPVRSDDDLRRVAAPALEHLRAALAIDQAYLMRVIPDPDDPYLTMQAFASIPINEDVEAHPLAQRYALSLMPPVRRAMLEAGDILMGLPDRDDLNTPAQQNMLHLDRAATRLTLPIRIDGTLWGVLGFNGLSERVWSQQEQTVLRTAAEMFSHVVRRRIAEDELRRSEEQFRTAVETMLDGFAILDSVRDANGAICDFRYRYINDVGCQLNQQPRAAHLGRSLLELRPNHRGSDLFAAYVRLVETGVPVSRESLVYEDQSGAGERLVRVFDVRAARLGDGFAVIWRDVTDQRLAHESLATANEDLLRRVNELRTLNLVAQTLAFTQDLRAGFETVCAAVAEQTGAAAATIVGLRQHGQTNLDLELDQLAGTRMLSPDELGSSAEAFLAQRRSLLLSRTAPNFPLTPATLQRLACSDAAHILLVPLSTPTGNQGLLVLQSGPDAHPFTADDQSLAETMAGQIATAISNVQLGEQAQRAAALAERNRVARDLHDSATQALYSLVLLSGGWALKAENGRLTEIPAKFSQLSQIAVQVLKELRLLIYQLRHPELEAGLISALEERLAAVEQRANMTTTLDVEGDLRDLTPEQEEQLYVMLQEALNNALRHGQAQRVALSIRPEADSIVFCVCDDGVGFDPTTPSAGMGIRSMHERAAKLGARLVLESWPKQGTRIEIRVPVPTTGGDARG